MNIRINQKCLIATLSLGVLLLGSRAFVAGDDDGDRNSQFDFALIGDVPYSPTGTVLGKKVQTYPTPEYNAVIADINSHSRVQFTAHVGDIKAGDTWCNGGNTAKDLAGASDVYTSNLVLFNSFRNAVIYMPGDNEWTDCHRANNGAYDPQERLAYTRSVFFTSNLSLGQHPIALTRQSSDAGFELYRENVTWRVGAVLFVGINQPGSNNNHQRNVKASSPLPGDDNEAEYTARNNANIVWLNKAFDRGAADPTIRGIVIMQQANPFERFLEPNQGYTRSGYEQFITTLRNRTVAYGKPVVMVGGDTHTVRIDKPLTTLYPGHTLTGIQLPTDGTRIQNFTRVEVFGSPDTFWVRGIVDSYQPNVFSFAMHTIAGNGHERDGRTDDDDWQ